MAHNGKTDHSEQSRKFERAARDLECDVSEDRFNANLKRIAKATPPKSGKSEQDKSGE